MANSSYNKLITCPTSYIDGKKETMRIRNVSVTSQVVDYLRENIESGDWAVGESGRSREPDHFRRLQGHPEGAGVPPDSGAGCLQAGSQKLRAGDDCVIGGISGADGDVSGGPAEVCAGGSEVP